MEKENKILIFRTSITQRRDIKRIGELLAEFPQIDKWNVDFEDWEKQNFMDKEKYSFLNPKGIETFAFIFSGNALQWLHGTTTDDNGRKIGNFTLFGDLLARMALADGTAKGFYRPLTLSVGQAQYSEEQLSTQWSMGRKRIRRLLDELARLELIDTSRSRVASVMTFPCLLQWMTKDGSVVSNPFIHKQRERIEPL